MTDGRKKWPEIKAAKNEYSLMLVTALWSFYVKLHIISDPTWSNAGFQVCDFVLEEPWGIFSTVITAL